MDFRLADQLGRELAWSHCRQAGIVSDEMVKQAGLLEGILFAPLTAIAAMISAPWGSKMRTMGMGLLLGAGMGAVADREVDNRQSKGEEVGPKQMGPAMKAIMAGIAMGGGQRVQRDLVTGKPISQGGAILTGAPLGAFLSSSPSTGMAVGAVSASLLSAMQGAKGGERPNPVQSILGALSGARQPEPKGSMISPAAQLMREVQQAAPRLPLDQLALDQSQAAQTVHMPSSLSPMSAQNYPAARQQALPQALKPFLSGS